MADISDFLFGGIKATNDLFRLGYSVYQDRRNYEYQKGLQNKIFAREDSAIQRRVADAQEAGINPYDAISAGSGAGASSAGGVSSTPLPDLNVGSWFDGAIAKQQLAQQREKTKQEKDLSSIIDFQKARAYRQNAIENWAFRYNTGLSLYTDKNGYYIGSDNNGIPNWISDKPFMKMLEAGYQNFMNQSDMLQTDRDWYSTNKILDAINSGTGSIGNVAGAFNGGFGAYRNYEGGKYFRAQRNYFEPEFTYPKHEMGFHP